MCHHAFHLHCIWKWLETDTSRGLCPMCRQPFHTDKSLPVNQGVDASIVGCGPNPSPGMDTTDEQEMSNQQTVETSSSSSSSSTLG